MQKHIVGFAVRFSDGSTQPVDEANLRALLRELDLQRLFPRSTYGDPAVILEIGAEMRRRRKAAKSETARENASGPRKTITKNDLTAFRDRYFFEKGYKQGWIAAAGRYFKIDPKTVSARMRETSSSPTEPGGARPRNKKVPE